MMRRDEEGVFPGGEGPCGPYWLGQHPRDGISTRCRDKGASP
jgi:hypothetical protein